MFTLTLPATEHFHNFIEPQPNCYFVRFVHHKQSFAIDCNDNIVPWKFWSRYLERLKEAWKLQRPSLWSRHNHFLLHLSVAKEKLASSKSNMFHSKVLDQGIKIKVRIIFQNSGDIYTRIFPTCLGVFLPLFNSSFSNSLMTSCVQLSLLFDPLKADSGISCCKTTYYCKIQSVPRLKLIKWFKHYTH